MSDIDAKARVARIKELIYDLRNHGALGPYRDNGRKRGQDAELLEDVLATNAKVEDLAACLAKSDSDLDNARERISELERSLSESQRQNAALREVVFRALADLRNESFDLRVGAAMERLDEAAEQYPWEADAR